MAYGLETFDENGNVIIDSPTAVYDFYAGSQSLSNTEQSLSSSGYTDIGAVLVPNEPYGLLASCVTNADFWSANRYNKVLYYINAEGVVSNGTYYPPSKKETDTHEGTFLDFKVIANASRVYTKTSTAYKFGKFQNGSTGAGIEVINDQGQTVLSSESVPLFIQPKTDNNFKRTVTCRSYGLDESSHVQESSGGPSVVTFEAEEKTPNLVFDKAYDKPPLIFVVDSQGVPVSIWGYNTNESGKYIGATITTNALPIGTVPTRYYFNWISVADTWRFGENQDVDIDVIVVSDEYPDYLDAPDYGLQTFNGSGVVTYDSRLSPVAFDIDNKEIPYWRCRQVGDYIFGSSQYYKDRLGESSFTKSGLDTAVCLNTFNCSTGFMVDIVSHSIIGGSEAWEFNFYGRYVAISKSEGNTDIDIIAGGTGHVGRLIGGDYVDWILSQYNSSIQPIVSIDANRGQTTTFDVLTMSW